MRRVAAAVVLFASLLGSTTSLAASAAHPELRLARDGVLLGAGFALMGSSQFLEVTIQSVPPEGLDPAEISWSFDRDQIGHLDSDAVPVSDMASAAAFAYPMVLAFVSQPSGERTKGTLRRALVYVEAYTLATGLATLIKNSADRPRPYTYLSDADRPDDATYDVTEKEAFQSFPSSHASTSFCGAAFAMTDHLLTRPDAGWLENVGVSFTGGLLAGMTSTLRVRAGKHFPSDTIAGGAIGMASGIAVPLAHKYVIPSGLRAPGPSDGAWLQSLVGLCAGVGAGIAVAEAAY